MFGSVEAMLSASADKPLWRAVLEDDCQDRDADPAASLARMGRLWQAMKESLEEYDPARRSASGLSGGQGARMADLADPICGSFVQEVASVALKLGEHNACMGRIVAAPTAGACGVLPAVLIPLQRREGLSDETMVECLYVSAGFGQVIAQRASISGAEGGCQAEVGSASAMAAAALIHARGGPGARRFRSGAFDKLSTGVQECAPNEAALPCRAARGQREPARRRGGEASQATAARRQS